MRQPEAELDVTVLTTGFWPVPVIKHCKLPPVAQSISKQFTDFYTNLHTGRRLTWQTNLGTADLRCKFDKGRKELVVHTYQMCILMLYNQRDTYTFKEIMEITEIPEQVSFGFSAYFSLFDSLVLSFLFFYRNCSVTFCRLPIQRSRYSRKSPIPRPLSLRTPLHTILATPGIQQCCTNLIVRDNRLTHGSTANFSVSRFAFSRRPPWLLSRQCLLGLLKPERTGAYFWPCFHYLI
jgi:hypothetical protein